MRRRRKTCDDMNDKFKFASSTNFFFLSYYYTKSYAKVLTLSFYRKHTTLKRKQFFSSCCKWLNSFKIQFAYLLSDKKWFSIAYKAWLMKPSITLLNFRHQLTVAFHASRVMLSHKSAKCLFLHAMLKHSLYFSIFYLQNVMLPIVQYTGTWLLWKQKLFCIFSYSSFSSNMYGCNNVACGWYVRHRSLLKQFKLNCLWKLSAGLKLFDDYGRLSKVEFISQ